MNYIRLDSKIACSYYKSIKQKLNIGKYNLKNYLYLYFKSLALFKFQKYWFGFVQLLFPDICITCGEKLLAHEKFLCLKCVHDIPRTNFHNTEGNKAEQLFWGRVKIENAVSFYYFRKGSRYQKLVHKVKYNGLKELGFETGKLYGFELAENNVFPDIDLLIPVPLHPKKYRKRGFNQSEWIAKGIGAGLQKPATTEYLKRLVYTSTQTRKNRFDRWKNVDGIFEAQHPEKLKNKHVLVIDDVITTGATLEACIVALQKIPGIKVSIATLAFADY